MRRLASAIGAVLVLAAGCSNERGEGTVAEPPSSTTESTATPPADPPVVDGTPPPVRARLVAEFDQPVMLAPIPGEAGSFYVIEKTGRLRALDGDGAGDTLLDLSDVVSKGGEQGLLGLAVAPGGTHLYLNYTNVDGDTRVVEYAIDGKRIDSSSRRELLAVDQPYSNHNGGHLEFGPDGALYVALGDGGSRGDPQGNAQDPSSSLGKILRIDVTSPDAQPEIFALGLRNPWRFSIDTDGTLWIGDVGQSSFEEVNRSPGTRAGVNYGWDRLEGFQAFEGEPPAEHLLPLHVYERADGNCAVTGGRVYRGSKIDGLRGWYLFGDYCRGELLALPSAAGRPAKATRLGVQVDAIASFAADGDGELFALSLSGGVYRIEAGNS